MTIPMSRIIGTNKNLKDNLFKSKLSPNTRLKALVKITNPEHELFGMIGYITNYNSNTSDIYFPLSDYSGHKVGIKWDCYSSMESSW